MTDADQKELERICDEYTYGGSLGVIEAAFEYGVKVGRSQMLHSVAATMLKDDDDE
jgi:hypothetical protein